MKTLFVFLFVLLAFYSCDMDDPINAEDSLVTTDKETDAIELTAQSGSYLIGLMEQVQKQRRLQISCKQ
ncbi:hypothetical protein NXY00_18745 [Bacteroides sp. BFG-551]|nr:hypothetical protein [Bacteroides sp. BFG-551]